MSGTKQKVYFISGLGVDERAFEKIRLPEGYEICFIHWIEPEKKESFRGYCGRLLGQVDTREPLILAGLSFGGITAVEISKMVPVKKIILLSSIACSGELPRLYRFLAFFGVHRHTPSSWVKHATAFSYWLFGTKTSDAKKMLRAILADISDNFLYWAAETIIQWRNEEKPPRLFHIHGSNDHVLYCSRTHPDVIIKGAGHFMVYTHADEVNRALVNVLIC